MSSLATAPPAPTVPSPSAGRPASPQLFEAGGPTLEDSIVTTWEALSSDGQAECPVCQDEMVAGDGCPRCGAQLS